MALTFTEYQQLSADTRIYPDQYSVIYPSLGLAGETGEVMEKVKKALRDDLAKNHGFSGGGSQGAKNQGHSGHCGI